MNPHETPFARLLGAIATPRFPTPRQTEAEKARALAAAQAKRDRKAAQRRAIAERATHHHQEPA